MTILKIAAFLLLGTLAGAQLPDAPQPQSSGCLRGTMNAAGEISYIEVKCSSIPAWKPIEPAPPKPAGFWTFRSSWEQPPLRSNRKTFDKKFILLHAGAAIAMVVACRDRSSQEDWASEVPAVAGVTALDYVASRFFTEAFSVEAPVYAIVHYSRSASR